jgi:hypothetical protein
LRWKSYPAVSVGYAGQPNTFAGEIEMKERGEYVVDICDPANSNMGVRRAKIHVQ